MLLERERCDSHTCEGNHFVYLCHCGANVTVSQNLNLTSVPILLNISCAIFPACNLNWMLFFSFSIESVWTWTSWSQCQPRSVWWLNPCDCWTIASSGPGLCFRTCRPTPPSFLPMSITRFAWTLTTWSVPIRSRMGRELFCFFFKHQGHVART